MTKPLHLSCVLTIFRTLWMLKAFIACIGKSKMLFKAESMDNAQISRQESRNNFQNRKIRRIIEWNHHNQTFLPFQMEFLSFDKSFWCITIWKSQFSKERKKTVLWRSISWRFDQNSKISKSQDKWYFFWEKFHFLKEISKIQDLDENIKNSKITR